MRPLSKEEETDAEVTWQDQNNINTFSKLHNKLQDLQDLLTERNVPAVSATELTVDTPRVPNRCVTGDGVAIIR